MKIYNSMRIIIGTALILLVPLVAMLFTNEVKWSGADFAIMAALLLGTGFLFEFITSKLNPKYRPVVAVVLIAALLLAWAELAVGIFGTPFAGS